MSLKYEYCVMPDGDSHNPHRGPWEFSSIAEEWIKQFEDAGGKKGAFYIARRPLHPWERFTR